VPQEVVRSAFAISGKVLRTDQKRNSAWSGSSDSVSREDLPTCSVGVIEQLREQVKCIEGRLPILGPVVGNEPAPKLTSVSLQGSLPGSLEEPLPGFLPEICPSAALSPGRHDDAQHNAANGAAVDMDHQEQSTPGMLPCLRAGLMQDQTAFPAGRFVHEDGGALPRAPSSSSLFGRSMDQLLPTQSQHQELPCWSLDDPLSRRQSAALRDHRDITQLRLDTAGVHEIKPAFHSAEPSSCVSRGVTRDWEACWSAARRFQIALMARRLISASASSNVIGQAATRPILWCLPRAHRREHGTPFLHGLQQFGLRSCDIILVETSNHHEMLWALEEGLKSNCLALVAGVLDDIELTPARRLALAAQQSGTPCLVLTHPRSPSIAATATRWRIGAAPSGPHTLERNCSSPVLRGTAFQNDQTLPDSFGFPGSFGSPSGSGLQANPSLKNFPGAQRFILTLERYRMMPRQESGHDVVVEWCDETLCLRLVPELSNRSHATRPTQYCRA